MNTKGFLLLVSLFAPMHLHAAPFGLDVNTDWNYVGTLSLGAVWPNNMPAQTFFLTPSIEKTYTTGILEKATQGGELFIGIQEPLNDLWLGQAGVALAIINRATFSGSVWDDADPSFDNYTYSFHLQHSHLAVKGKLLATPDFFHIQPWVDASVGVGLNSAHDFTNTPKIFEAVPTPNFASTSNISFTWTAGAGAQYVINSCWQIGLGYEYTRWGKSQFERAEGQTLSHGLTFETIHTHAVLGNVTYLP